MAVLANLARMTTATVGTGTITLGSAATACLTFAQAGIVDGDTVSYGIEDGNDSEVGRGVYTASGTTLTRSVLKSTNSDNAISLSGTAEVFVAALAEDIRFRGASVKKSVDQTGADYTTATAVAWDDEYFDIGGWHDTVTENTKLTVPAGSGISYVEVTAFIEMSLGANDTQRGVFIQQDGTTTIASNHNVEGGGTAMGITVNSGPIAVVAGTTYFECLFRQETDTSITINAATSRFSIRAVG